MRYIRERHKINLSTFFTTFKTPFHKNKDGIIVSEIVRKYIPQSVMFSERKEQFVITILLPLLSYENK